jgi:hypothetical protein
MACSRFRERISAPFPVDRGGSHQGRRIRCRDPGGRTAKVESKTQPLSCSRTSVTGQSGAAVGGPKHGRHGERPDAELRGTLDRKWQAPRTHLLRQAREHGATFEGSIPSIALIRVLSITTASGKIIFHLNSPPKCLKIKFRKMFGRPWGLQRRNTPRKIGRHRADVGQETAWESMHPA